MRELIRLRALRRAGGSIVVPLECSAGIRPYLRERAFWATYQPALALDRIPDSILYIPAVSSLLGLCWALGASVSVDVLDARFVDAARAVARVLQAFYPSFRTSESDMLVGRLDSSLPIMTERVGLLYSGGIDSNSSLISHRDEVTDLFTVWGADVATRNARYWNSYLVPLIRGNAPTRGKRLHFIRSNTREMVDELRLERELGKVLPGESWWGAVQHGLGLISLTAPVAFREGIGRILMASTFSESLSRPWGSHPDVDDRLAWSGCSVAHDGFHRTRQAKIREVLAPYVLAGHRLRIAPCDRSTRGHGRLNCGVCVTCAKAQAGLLVAGVDPRLVGFALDETTVQQVISKFERHSYLLGPTGAQLWRDVQDDLPADPSRVLDLPGARSYVEWLRTFDFVAYAERVTARSDPPWKTSGLHLAKRIFRTLPWGIRERVTQTRFARAMIET